MNLFDVIIYVYLFICAIFFIVVGFGVAKDAFGGIIIILTIMFKNLKRRGKSNDKSKI